MLSISSLITKEARETSLRNILLIGACSFFIALCAQLSLSIPFLTVVPFSLQVHAVLLVSALLGAKRAFMCLSLYVFEGACGLPVFVHGNGGLAFFMGPTVGYLLSYLPVSYLVGLCFEKWGANASWAKRVSFFALGNAIVLLCGMCWLSLYAGLDKSWKLGVYPFLGTDMLKTLVIASMIPSLNSFSKWISDRS